MTPMLYLIALTDIVMAAVFVKCVLWDGFNDYRSQWK